VLQLRPSWRVTGFLTHPVKHFDQTTLNEHTQQNDAAQLLWP
jgi:hypothetical protein